MIAPLYGVPEIMERYRCDRHKAAQIIHQMQHLESPRLLAPEWAVVEWERQQMEQTAKPKGKRTAPKPGRVLVGTEQAPYHIPRRRETA